MIRSRFHTFRLAAACAAVAALVLAGCGDAPPADRADATPGASDGGAGGDAAAPATPASEPEAVPSTTPPDLPNALVLALAQFGPREPGKAPKPLPATLEFLVRRGGQWTVGLIEDPMSNVFHKAMLYETPEGRRRLLTAAGTAATLKLWQAGENGPTSETIWEKDFGGKFSRMRDVEVGDIYGDGSRVIAVATHDQGVVALVKPDAKGGYTVEEIDAEPDTFVHEIELGDLDGDGVLEVYATPSEPNRLDGRAQQGIVTRYVPAKKEGRVVVADLGNRHAKEIFVHDVDGDNRDELYVIVEGEVEKGTQQLTAPVEIRRYDATTPATEGVVVATFQDRLGRFLTAGDFDGDGREEMVASLFSSGVWLLTPEEGGTAPTGRFRTELIDKDSGGFEHAAVAADLDGDGRHELYVASDNDSEVRRYVWQDGEFSREVIYRRTNGNSVFTWNVMPVPVDLAP